MKKTYSYDVIMAKKEERKNIKGMVKLEDGTWVIVSRSGDISISMPDKWLKYFQVRADKKLVRPVSFTFSAVEVNAIAAGIQKIVEWDVLNKSKTKLVAK